MAREQHCHYTDDDKAYECVQICSSEPSFLPFPAALLKVNLIWKCLSKLWNSNKAGQYRQLPQSPWPQRPFILSQLVCDDLINYQIVREYSLLKHMINWDEKEECTLYSVWGPAEPGPSSKAQKSIHNFVLSAWYFRIAYKHDFVVYLDFCEWSFITLQLTPKNMLCHYVG